MSVDPEGTPEPGNSPDPTPAPTENWEQRFKDTQAAFTRSQQELAALQKLANGEDPDALKAVLDKYGYELADDDEPEEDTTPDPVVVADPRIDKFEQWQQQVEAERAEAAFNSDLSKAAGDRDVPKQGRDWILQQTISNGGDYKALEAATNEWFGFVDELVNTQQKKRPRAPHVPTGGTPAPDAKDTAHMSISELNRFAMDRLNAETA